ncbi:MAG: AtpZ/AtpI family protein [Helicobacteraceae bacterium]|nr:AtpZ/AtpI family protein [Helicobacteraceae bacterium]
MSDKPPIKQIIEGAGDLSLALSMAAAVAIGFGIGYGLRSWLGYEWLLWLGVFWGVSAAILNLVKAIRKLGRSMKELENNPRYRKQSERDDDEEED